MSSKRLNEENPFYRLEGKGCFVIENYNQSKVFSNFFPGVAGIWGIPMWVFFVNRGQCISSFGIEGKDKAITEFHPANKAYRLTATQGFRTFLKIKSGPKNYFWEPFQSSVQSPYRTRQTMRMTAYDLTIEDVNETLGIAVRVNYFTLPEESFPALVRRVSIENISKKKLDVEAVDGLPLILPYGTKDWLAKHMSRTVEAWFKVKNLEKKAPFYHLNVEVSDTPDVTHISEGNFYCSFESKAGKARLLDPIVESSCVFGRASDLVEPQEFLRQKNFSVPKEQQTSNRTSSAMSFTKFTLAPKGLHRITALTGYVHSQRALNTALKRAASEKYISEKAALNEEVVEGIGQNAFTLSSSVAFNLYSSQTFIDNVLRGGLPVSLETAAGPVTFNVFSRKHGDLERDYNYFVLSPTYYSQGNGNFRDVNQNRRNDVWFNGDLKDAGIVDFLSLVQADGYNPLVVKGMSFLVNDPDQLEVILHDCLKGDSEHVRALIKKGFQPGDLLHFIQKEGVGLKVKPQVFLNRLLGICRKQSEADHGEGFWVDHWTYCIDLVESYLSVYPECRDELLFGKDVFSFYHNNHYVLPRQRRYVLTERGVRQYHSVKNGRSEIGADERGNVLRTSGGEGEPYYTTLFCKLLCLAANKAATLDPSGIGIEMEADKPGWYDALNGLPGLLGSSICETFELKRYCLFLLKALEGNRSGLAEVPVFEELAIFIGALTVVLSAEQDPLSYWNQSNEVKEQYREKIKHGISGQEKKLSVETVKEFLKLVIQRVDRGIECARDSRGLFPTYFYHEVAEYEELGEKSGQRYVNPLRFKRRHLPLFLEGFVHALRLYSDGQTKEAEGLHRAVKRSTLYDKSLKMYKVNTNLHSETEEIGRTRNFPSGWLENESIWLHMEYKYLLELLRCGLYEDFYEDFKSAMVPFLKAEIYGRSILENSSFIVSSAHEDASLHGRGFVARLSGSTAEFVHLWLLMNLGLSPFRTDGHGALQFTPRPALAGWLFTEKPSEVRLAGFKAPLKLPKDTYAFMLFGSVPVVYHNPGRKNTFGPGAASAVRIDVQYPGNKQTVRVDSGSLPERYATDLRNRKVLRLDIFLQ